MRNPRLDLLEGQRRVLRDLVEHLLLHPDAVEPPFRHDLGAAQGEGARLRVVVDQVASLTDISAPLWGERLGV